MRKRPKSKAQRGLVTVLIVYASHKRPHALGLCAAVGRGEAHIALPALAAEHRQIDELAAAWSGGRGDEDVESRCR
ncbi:MAG: hypothetical protein ACT4NY_19200, partial [Pseudonocardiales bacterium]